MQAGIFRLKLGHFEDISENIQAVLARDRREVPRQFRDVSGDVGLIDGFLLPR
jgi:hypothetical protein